MGGIGRGVRVSLIGLLVVACGSTPVPSGGVPGSDAIATPPASAEVTQRPATASPITSSAPSLTVAPSVTPTATPSPTPRTVNASWSAPKEVSAAACFELVVGFDDGGTAHAAATCGTGVRVWDRRSNGAWAATKLVPPARRHELDPQLAFDGTTAYVAYSRVAITEGGCGDDGLRDVGVYYRHRSLPNGSWSAPIRLGVVNDSLLAFRVVRGTVYATVQNGKQGPIFYETRRGTVNTRARLPGAVGGTSLRVANDGSARIAYEAADSLRYAVAKDASITWSKIPGTNGEDYAPSLVLDANDHADLVWTHAFHGLGCAGPGPQPRDGTYFGTNAGGSWDTKRLTKAVGGTSLTLNASNGDLEVLLAVQKLHELTRTASGAWTSTTIPGPILEGAVIRIDPTTNTLLIVYLEARGIDGQGGGIFAITKAP
jgi:hypothetical protein